MTKPLPTRCGRARACSAQALTTARPLRSASKQVLPLQGMIRGSSSHRSPVRVAISPILEAAAQGIGAINWLPDRDQIVRRVPLLYRAGTELVPSLAAELLRVAQDASTYVLKAANASGETAFGRNTGLNHLKIGDLEIPTDADGGIFIKFRPSNPAAYIPAWKVLSGEVAREEVDGRIVLVGTSAPGLLDLARHAARFCFRRASRSTPNCSSTF